MTSNDNINFFDQQKANSRIKARIVSEYFPHYCQIIASKHMPERFGYFDLFSGPGVYEDGQESTPILLARNCLRMDFLRQRLWMVFNDAQWSDRLKDNFYQRFTETDFRFRPHFGHSMVGEEPEIDKFLRKSWMKQSQSGRVFNECPSVLFIDPFGYKAIHTAVLTDFMKSWGNEVFIFINSKRINQALGISDSTKPECAIRVEKISDDLQNLFPTTFLEVKENIRKPNTLQQRFQVIINAIGEEFKRKLGHVFYTAFMFQEEDINTTSHFILHITKGPKGYELIKQIYNDFDNVGAAFDAESNTYTFDAKMDNRAPSLFEEELRRMPIDTLAERLWEKYANQTISAQKLFDEDQKDTKFCRMHYAMALRSLYSKGALQSRFTDDKKHVVSVLINDNCILTFVNHN